MARRPRRSYRRRVSLRSARPARLARQQHDDGRHLAVERDHGQMGKRDLPCVRFRGRAVTRVQRLHVEPVRDRGGIFLQRTLANGRDAVPAALGLCPAPEPLSAPGVLHVRHLRQQPPIPAANRDGLGIIDHRREAPTGPGISVLERGDLSPAARYRPLVAGGQQDGLHLLQSRRPGFHRGVDVYLGARKPGREWLRRGRIRGVGSVTVPHRRGIIQSSSHRGFGGVDRSSIIRGLRRADDQPGSPLRSLAGDHRLRTRLRLRHVLLPVHGGCRHEQPPDAVGLSANARRVHPRLYPRSI